MDEVKHRHDLVTDAVHVAGIVEPRVAAGEDARPLLHVGPIVVARSFHEPDDDQHDPGDGEEPPHSPAIDTGGEAHATNRRERATSRATSTKAWTRGCSPSRRQAMTVSSDGPRGHRGR